MVVLLRGARLALSCLKFTKQFQADAREPLKEAQQDILTGLLRSGAESCE
jgi:hypothetical protein